LHPGVIHDAMMPNLPPNTQVWYQIRSSAQQQRAVFSFRTAPIVGPDTAVSLFAFGDSGVSYCQGMEGWCEPASGPTYLNIKSDMESNSNFSLVVQYVLQSLFCFPFLRDPAIFPLGACCFQGFIDTINVLKRPFGPLVYCFPFVFEKFQKVRSPHTFSLRSREPSGVQSTWIFFLHP
jgi:hypothetical protein